VQVGSNVIEADQAPAKELPTNDEAAKRFRFRFFRKLGERGVGEGRDLNLDVVRGIAVLLAMGWHFNKEATSPWFDLLLTPGRILGWAGVDLFFVLSGFLVGRLLLKEKLQTGDFAYARFFIRRALKLWPTLYVFLGCMIAVQAAPLGTFLPQIALHVQNYFPPRIATHLWSLAVEEHFYLGFGLLFLFFCRQELGARYLLITIIIAVVAASILRGIAIDSGVPDLQIQWQTQYRVDAIGVGVLLAFWSLTAPRHFSKACSYKWILLVLCLLSYTAVAILSKNGPWGSLFGFVFAYLAAAFLLLYFYEHRYVRRIPFIPTVIALIGANSYAMYIWHVPVAHLVDLLENRIGHTTTELSVISKYVSSVLFALLMTKVVEVPFLRLRDRLFPSAIKAG